MIWADPRCAHSIYTDREATISGRIESSIEHRASSIGWRWGPIIGQLRALPTTANQPTLSSNQVAEHCSLTLQLPHIQMQRTGYK